MRLFKSLVLVNLLCVFGVSSSHAPAQIGIGVNIGPEPVCPYGYFEYPPYDCAPYGYYGPDWFAGGIFIGAGPWFHGPHGFYGHVDNRFDPHHGYRGPLPGRGERPFNGFQANEAHDGRGHTGNAGHDGGREHTPGFAGGGHPGGGHEGGGRR
ncbi:MAG: hypothetical protein ABSD59_02230 [Terracidiphilus sp.]